MKKQLIKEAFRLQQLAGITPINEIGQGMPSVASDLQTVGISPGDSISWVKYEGGSEKFNQGTAQQLIDLVNQKLKSAGYEYDFFAEPSEFTDFAQYGEGLTSVCSIAVGDTYQFDIAKGMSRGMQKEAEGGSISILKDLYYFDKLNMLAAMSDVDSKYHSYGSLVFTKGDSIQPGSEEYDMILDSPSLESNVHYSTGSQGMQKETSLSEQEDPGFEALIDDLILKIAQNYAEEGEDVEDYMGVAAEDAVELIRRKYRV